MGIQRLRPLGWVLSLTVAMRLAGAAQESVAAAREETSGSVFSIPLLDLDIRMKDAAWRALSLQTMEAPKLYAEATVRTKSGSWPSVGIKLKGSYGSFQSAEERPGLTLHFDKFKGARRFAGLTRLHLNNGAQDDSRLHEWLGGELARAAGVPAGRAGHAWLTLQGRDRGLYVIRESFTPEFLSEWFGPPGKGDLYDAAAGGDLRPGMEKDQGEEGEDAALTALIDACNVEDANSRRSVLCRDSLKMSSRGLVKNVPLLRGREAATPHGRTLIDEPEGAAPNGGAGRSEVEAIEGCGGRRSAGAELPASAADLETLPEGR